MTDIPDQLAALKADLGTLRQVLDEARTHHAAMSQDLDNARSNLAEARTILDSLNRLLVGLCPVCDGTGGDHQLGCQHDTQEQQ